MKGQGLSNYEMNLIYSQGGVLGYNMKKMCDFD